MCRHPHVVVTAVDDSQLLGKETLDPDCRCNSGKSKPSPCPSPGQPLFYFSLLFHYSPRARPRLPPREGKWSMAAATKTALEETKLSEAALCLPTGQSQHWPVPQPAARGSGAPADPDPRAVLRASSEGSVTSKGGTFRKLPRQ